MLPALQSSAQAILFRFIFLTAAATPIVLNGQEVQIPSAPKNANKTVDKQWVIDNLDTIRTLYRHLHQHPELSFEEQETAQRFAKELSSVGATVTSNIGGHGVVGIVENGPGPTVMLRADLDGLPVREQTELVYSSTVTTVAKSGAEVGVMHACGHDIHMSNLIGVAKYLTSHKSDWSGTLMMIGQPAEERGAGAKAMLDEGLFKKFPKPDYALALHVDASLRTGDISYLGGFQQANVDSIDIVVRGSGGHGAYPHKTIDPIVQASQLVLALQTIVSREIDPIEPAVVTVGSIHGGSKHNVIDDTCTLQLTVRSYSSDVRKQLHASIKRIAQGVAKTAGAPEPQVEISEGTPSLLNDPALAKRLLPVFQSEIGAEHVLEAKPSMGGEDFSRYGIAGVPILMFRLGTVNEKRLERFKSLGQTAPSLHSPRYYPDARESLTTGIRAMSAAAIHLLQQNERNEN